MENQFVDAATADLAVKIGWQVAGWVLAGVVGVISGLLWGKGGRKRLVETTKTLEKDNNRLSERITALEAQTRAPSISQTFNFHSGRDRRRDIQSAIEAATVRGLQETIRILTQHPLSGGHTYAELPDGTNIVTLADGTIRLALPVRLSASFEGGLGGSLGGEPSPKDDDD